MNRSRPLATDAPTETDPVTVTLAGGSNYRDRILESARDLDARGETVGAESTLARHATVVRLTTVREARQVRDAATHALNRGRHPGGATTRSSIERVRDEAADALDAHERAMSRTRDPDDMPADPMDRSASDYDVSDCLPDGGERDDDDGARLTEDGIDLTGALVSIEDYRYEDHIEVVAETDDRVVVRDSAGYELSEWADDLGISRRDLSLRMHELAREHYGREQVPPGGDPWCASDPLVLAKPDDESDENHRIMTDGGIRHSANYDARPHIPSGVPLGTLARQTDRAIFAYGVDPCDNSAGWRHVDPDPCEPMEEPRAAPHDPIEHIPAAIRVAVGTLCRERDVSFVRWNGSSTDHTACLTVRPSNYVSDWMLPAGVTVRGATPAPDAGCIDIKLKTTQPE